MRAALALLLHAGAVLSARHEFGRTCELHDLDERPTGLWRVFPDLRWLWSGSPNAAEEIRVSKERRRRLSEWTGTFASDCVTLNLFGDQLSLRQVEGVAASLPEHPRLTHLQLRNTSIGDAGAAALATALAKRTPRLRHVSLGANRITDTGAIALADALSTNVELTALDLGGNDIGVPGARAIREMLDVNHALTHLPLMGNPIGDEMLLREIERELRYNRGFQHAASKRRLNERHRKGELADRDTRKRHLQDEHAARRETMRKWADPRRLNALHPDKYPAKGLAPMGEDHPLAQGLSADEVEWHEPEQAGGPPRDNDGWEELDMASLASGELRLKSEV